MSKLINTLYLKVASDPLDLGDIQYSTKQVHGAPDYRTQLHDMYELLECRTLEHFTLRTLKGTRYDLWFDEEGKLLNPMKLPCIPIVYNGKVRDVIVGHCIVTTSDAEGDIAEITEEGIKEFLDYLKYCWACANAADRLILQEA